MSNVALEQKLISDFNSLNSIKGCFYFSPADFILMCFDSLNIFLEKK